MGVALARALHIQHVQVSPYCVELYVCEIDRAVLQPDGGRERHLSAIEFDRVARARICNGIGPGVFMDE